MANLLTDGYTTEPKRPLYGAGEKIQTVKAVVTIAAADDDADTIIIARNVPIDTVVTRLFINKAVAAITNGTDYDIGFYRAGGADGSALGAVLDADALVDGIDLSGGQAVGDILGSGVSGFDETDTIADLLSLSADQAPQGGVHIVITANTIGTVAGSIDMNIDMSFPG